MDKLIGKIWQKTVELGIAGKTLILVTGDNGTHTAITSMMGDRMVKGGKGKSTDAGTRVALIGYQADVIKPGQLNDDLIEFSDFMPTIAEAGGIAIPTKTDGQSFLSHLLGKKHTARDSIFIYYWPRPEVSSPLRFVRDKRWKLYGDGRLINVPNDEFEKSPVLGEARVRARLQRAMDSMPSAGQSLLKY